MSDKVIRYIAVVHMPSGKTLPIFNEDQAMMKWGSENEAAGYLSGLRLVQVYGCEILPVECFKDVS